MYINTTPLGKYFVNIEDDFIKHANNLTKSANYFLERANLDY